MTGQLVSRTGLNPPFEDSPLARKAVSVLSDDDSMAPHPQGDELTPTVGDQPTPAEETTPAGGLHGAMRRVHRVSARVRAYRWRLVLPGLQLGEQVRVGRGCRLLLDRNARLALGDKCELDDGTTIAVYGRGRVEMGPGSFAGHHCTLAAHSAIEIGAGTYVAELVSIRDHDHLIGAHPSSGQTVVDPIVVGRNVWIGAKVTVLRGARIGDGAIIGANAVVHGDIPPRSVCVGVPARVVRFLDQTIELG